MNNRKSKLINFCLLVLLSVSICIVVTPVWGKVSISNSQTKIAEGQILYDGGRFADAVAVLQEAVAEYQQQGNTLKQAVALSNLSLTYQQLGDWEKAQLAITTSLDLQGNKDNNNLGVLAQSLDIQGRLQLLTGNPEASLTTWQKTEDIYTKIGDKNGAALAIIYQAQALRNQGFNHQSLTKIQRVNETLATEDDSLTKAAVLLSLGETLENMGDGEKSRLALEQSLLISRRLNSQENISASLLSLANNARSQQKNSQAIAFYQQTFEISTSPLTKVQARLNHLNLLIAEKQFTAAQNLIPEIESLLAELPASRPSIYAWINFAHSLSSLNTPKSEIAPLLATAVQQAQNLDDIRAESYALGNLGTLYEQTQQLAEAVQLTEQALILSQTSNTPEIAYLWQWQIARLLKSQGNITEAIAAYDAAIATLESLRIDLVAVNQDIQFNFRDNVEPVYRQSVALLLSEEKPNVEILDKARTRIEALQLAELDNFFREACLQGEKVILDQVVDKENPQTAILYPIILPEELQVIVKIPQQPLRYHTVKKSQVELEQTLAELQEYILEPDRTAEVETLSQEVYNWLIKPIETDLQKNQVNTLVFVLDGALRNIPLAALYDGEKYLVEKYAVALSLGLQLLSPKALATTPVNVLAAGLVEPPPGFSTFPPLPGIKLEFDLIAQTGASTKQLIDTDFTSITLENNVNNVTFNVLHLATHGQFSSRPEDTFILANDGTINVLEFDSLLRSQSETNRQVLELLVLSACQTATGDNRATLGLAGAAIKAGARSTIASLWHINDQSTAILIGEFYNELVNNQVTKAEALRRAQVKLLTNYPNYRRPGYWAAYVLVGNWF
ncbi:CHAT domain-containing protein [Nodularia harveyana UHCC-0300]|uniref:CHAT domain-containing protein n=1 Tax=Nodularia harveyana UHCC-0300 TaxID=2974287 RepID=A0ABU5UEA6_9CYAN|nr:CHAT domain-containing protein [Nodularia harveyana]MEA5581877.1 CHAT domain-containing protein [Nodularia harveyana UHCC-0300]